MERSSESFQTTFPYAYPPYRLNPQNPYLKYLKTYADTLSCLRQPAPPRNP
ncbi:hypothetical protein NEISICOT_03433 [Neisseria sicca ATCC 29256]|uniref:Uncharacterized protein n=1 Tax=Neisseria sicca ATCC 29256 TaxID=547045 RepID=C6MA52_NEISI|nr:hypothetical protein NEISICOT_03433 [Neisseria sicca ATCC 29256]